jgi:hypothetical protein
MSMNILILADSGEPFSIRNDKMLIEWATRSLPFIGHYDEDGDHVQPTQLYFAVREDVDSMVATDALIDIYGVGVNIISFPRSTRGSLETAFLCASTMELDDPLLILNIQSAYNDEDILDTLVESMDFEDSMVVAYFDPINDSTQWPFAYSDGALVTSIIEHDVEGTLKGGQPLIGTFWFSTTRLFLKYAQFIIKNELKTGTKGKEEFYISQVPAMHVVNKGLVFTHKVDDVSIL